MRIKVFSTICGMIFVIIAVMHILRLSFSWEISIGGFTVPMWISYGAVAIFGYLGYAAFRLSR